MIMLKELIYPLRIDNLLKIFLSLFKPTIASAVVGFFYLLNYSSYWVVISRNIVYIFKNITITFINIAITFKNIVYIFKNKVILFKNKLVLFINKVIMSNFIVRICNSQKIDTKK